MTDVIKQPEAKSGLSKQLLGTFQAENSSDHKQLEAEVENRVAYKKTCIAMTELIKSISTSIER